MNIFLQCGLLGSSPSWELFPGDIALQCNMSKADILISTPPNLLFPQASSSLNGNPTLPAARPASLVLSLTPLLSNPSLTSTGNSTNSTSRVWRGRYLAYYLHSQSQPPSSLTRDLPALTLARPSPQVFPTWWLD